MSSFLRVGLSFLLLWFYLLPQATATTGSSGCNMFMCLNATMDDNSMVTYEITSLYQPFGWLAIGWGRKMDGSRMVIVWPNDDGTITFSQRLGHGHHEPAYVKDPLRIAFPVNPVSTSWNPPNSTRIAFMMHANRSALFEDPIEHLIWAYGMTRPAPREDADLLPHYRAGFLKIDYSKQAIPPPPPIEGQKTLPVSHGDPDDLDTFMDNHNFHQSTPTPAPATGNSEDDTKSSTEDKSIFTTPHNSSSPWGSHEKLIVAHGTLLATGFMILLPAGSLTARWGRTFTPKWFKVHSLINMTIALPIIVIGWLLGPTAVINNEGSHLDTAHQVCGVLLLAFYFLQVWLGRYIHRRRAEGLVPANKSHPPSNILHVCLGLLIIVLSFFQVRSGLDEWKTATGRGALSEWCHDLWLAWTFILPIAYLAGLSLLPRQLYQESQWKTIPGDYVVLSDAIDSPLLSNVERDGRIGRASMDSVQMVSEVEK